MQISFKDTRFKEAKEEKTREYGDSHSSKIAIEDAGGVGADVVDGKVQHVPGSEFIEECDWVIKATGQSKQTELFQIIEGIQLNPDGTILVNLSFHTTNEKYFAAGDAVSGGQEVVNAAADGKKAAKGIINFLKT